MREAESEGVAGAYGGARRAGQDELHDCGLQGLDRIARPIGGKVLLSHLWPLVDAWSKDGDWRKRYAALMCIAQIAEGSRKVLLADAALASLVGVLTAHSGDSHAIVKWSVCQAIGQVCTGARRRLAAAAPRPTSAPR